MFYAKKAALPIEEVQTTVWSCSNEQCDCWMRENFSFHNEPLCPICESHMIQGIRMLPVLSN